MEAQFADNNFWRIESSSNKEPDVDDLLKELEENGDEAAQHSQPSQQAKDNEEASEQ